MHLLIVSGVQHSLIDGSFRGHGPTVREIDYFGSIFSEITHVAYVRKDQAAIALDLPYANKHIAVRGVPLTGGKSLFDKVGVLRALPRYFCAIGKALGTADVVHVRAPANVSLLAMVLLAFVRGPRRRWIKYAGNWRPPSAEPWSYRFQRWWLRRNFARAKVTVNGRWPGDPPHVHAFPNPCITAAEYERAKQLAVLKRLEAPVTLLFAGSLTAKKGADIAVETLARLRDGDVDARLVVAGDGPEKPPLMNRMRALGLERWVNFLGFVPHPLLGEQYARAHFVLLPSRSEGWPKVLAEGMAYGAVPVASAVSSIPQVLEEAGCGCFLDSFDPLAYAAAVGAYLRDPERWRREALAGGAYAERFTYEAHVGRVQQLLGLVGDAG